MSISRAKGLTWKLRKYVAGVEVWRKCIRIVMEGELTSGALNTLSVYLFQRWDCVLHSKQSLYLPSYKHYVYQRFGFVTATLVQVPTFRDVTP